MNRFIYPNTPLFGGSGIHAGWTRILAFDTTSEPSEKEKAITKAREATEFAPFVEMVEVLSKDADSVKKRVDEIAETTKTAVERATSDLEAKFEKSMAEVVEHQTKMHETMKVWNKTSSLAASIEPVRDARALLEVIPKDVKALANHFEYQVCPAIPDLAKGIKSSPEVAMAVHSWFVRSTQAQWPRKFASELPRIAKEMDQIREALETHFYGNAETARVVKAAMQEDTAGEGGNLVPTIVGAEVMRLVTDNSKITPLCRPWPMTKKVEKVPAEDSAATVNWIDEEGTLTGGDPTFAQRTLTAEKLAGRATMSIELFEDSNVALLPFLLAVFSEKMAGELDKQMILGDGSGPQITGVMNGTGINAITSGTAAGRSLTYALLVSTFTGASEASARDGAYWFCSPAGYTQLLALVDSQGRPIVQFNPQGPPAGSIFNRPILESARLGGSEGTAGVATLDDTTNTATKIVFGPPRTMLFGTRTGMRWDVTDQVNWATYQMDARLIGRFAGDVGVPAAWTYLGQIAY